MSLNVIPNDISTLTPGESKIYRKIVSLYSQINRDCYLYVQPRLRNLAPDFILIDLYKGVCIIEIKDWSKNYINSMNKCNITAIDYMTLPNPVFRTNQYFNLSLIIPNNTLTRLWDKIPPFFPLKNENTQTLFRATFHISTYPLE